MKKKLRWLAALAALATAGPILAATGAATTDAGSGAVSGTQTVVDESAGTYAMHGSLVGPWQTTAFKIRYASATQFVGTGTELFSGCLDTNANGSCDRKEPAGTLAFTFMYWA